MTEAIVDDRRKSKLRILHFMVRVGNGGVERRRLQLARQLSRDDYEQIIVCTEAFGPIKDELLKAGCQVYEIGKMRRIFDIRAYFRAWKIACRFRPHIIHGAVFEGVALAAIVGIATRSNVVVGEETSDPQNRRRTGHFLIRFMYRLTDHCVAVSPGVGRYLRDDLGIAASKVTVITNGVPSPIRSSDEEKMTLQQTLGLSEEHLVVGGVGRMEDESHKRFGDLITAFSRLATPAARLLLVGDGGERPKLEALCGRLGIRDKVLFVGYQTETHKYYELMDIFCLTSQREAFGLVIAEAMRFGLPVVATNVGGVPDVVVDNVTGFLVEARDCVALSEALTKLINDPLLRKQMGEAGRHRSDSLFNSERYVGDVGLLYARLLKAQN